MVVQRPERELDPREAEAAPQTLRVDLRVRMLGRDAIRVRGDVGVQRGRRPERELCIFAHFVDRAIDALEIVHRKLGRFGAEQVEAGVRSLARERDRATLEESPLRDGNPAIYAARARRHGGYDAWLRRIEVLRDLHRRGHVVYVPVPIAHLQIRFVFDTGNETERHPGERRRTRRLRPPEQPDAAARDRIYDAAIVVVYRSSAQLRRRWI
jgi:hypothetical protein